MVELAPIVLPFTTIDGEPVDQAVLVLVQVDREPRVDLAGKAGIVKNESAGRNEAI